MSPAFKGCSSRLVNAGVRRLGKGVSPVLGEFVGVGDMSKEIAEKELYEIIEYKGSVKEQEEGNAAARKHTYL